MNNPTGLAPAAGMRLDRRLLLQLREHAFLLVGLLLLSLAIAGTITAAARLLSQAVTRAFLGSAGRADLAPTIALLVALTTFRALFLFLRDQSANRLSVSLRRKLRQRLTKKLLHLGPAYTRNKPSGQLTAVLFDGIEALDPYFRDYLPQLATAALVPVIILVVVFPLDALSGWVLLMTAPLIPFFMILIGRSANQRLSNQWSELQAMNGFFLERLQGLETLKVLGQNSRQLSRIRQVTERFRHSTLSVLRIAFLSALVLELAATLSTAIIAVQIGLRLLTGSLTFEVGFFILLLAPEYYLPMRRLGSHFHNSVSGLAAADQIFEIINTPTLTSKSPVANHALVQPPTIELRDVDYQYRARRHAALSCVNLRMEPGTLTAVVGPSGAGKSTLLNLLLRFIEPQAGAIFINFHPLAEISKSAWRSYLSWVPQQPYIMAGSLLENLQLGVPDASHEQVARAAQRAGLAPFIQSLPAGLATTVGERGWQLSAGQAQRLALARALLRESPLLLLDEPTSDLDPANQKIVLNTINQLRRHHTILWISHRLNFTLKADKVILLVDGSVLEAGAPSQLIDGGGHYARMVSTSLGETP